MKVSNNRKFINIMFDIFGYSFVGILSFAFGLVLQNYNSGGDFFKLIWNYTGNVRQVILVIALQLFLILIFGHAYARSILLNNELLKSQDGIDPCSIIGHWLETIIVIVAVMLVILQVVFPDLFNKYFWCTIGTNAGAYILSFLAYRRLRVKKTNSERDDDKKLLELKESSHYVLFCPAVVMIGLNILTGANICVMLEGNYLCYICNIVVSIGLGIVYFVKRYANKYFWAVCILIVLGIGIVSISDFGSMSDRLVLKNFFLATMVSVFLSIFESWYVVFRQKANSSNTLYYRITLGVVAAAPAVVAILFPIQDFNIIYYLTFWIGISVTDYISFVVVFPFVNDKQNKKEDGSEEVSSEEVSSEEVSSEDKYISAKRKVAIARACCGIATLIFLMLDKYFPFMPAWKDSGAQLVSDDVVSMVSLLASILGIVVPLFSHKKRNDGTEYWLDTNKHWRIEAYMTFRIILIFIAIIFSSYLYDLADGDFIKAKLSSGAIMLHLIVSMLIFWKSTQVHSYGKGNEKQ